MSRSQRPDAWVEAQLDKIRHAQGEAVLKTLEFIASEYARLGDGDQHGNWLITLLNVANNQGRFDYELRAFGELRRLYDSSDKYAHFKPNVLWYYKWLAEHIVEYTDISAAQIEAFFAEMEAFFRTAGEKLGPVYMNRCRTAIRMGRGVEAERWFNVWSAEPSGDSDDCAACIADFKLAYHFDRDENAQALAIAEDFLDGTLHCGETPITLSHLILPLMHERPEVAFGLQKFSARYVRKVPKAYYALAPHLVYLAVSGDFETGRRLVHVALHRAMESNNDAWRFSIYRATGFFFSAQALLDNRPIRLSRTTFSPERNLKAPLIPLPEAAARCFAEAKALADKFDARNGTGRYNENLEATEASIRRLVTALSKSKREE